VPVGRALDLGCGTGTNAIYLAQHSFAVTAIDISRRAIALAKRKARSASLGDRIRFERGDVTLMRRWALGQSIDFAYDIGCFHNLKAEHVGATYLRRACASLLSSLGTPQADRAGVALDEIAALFDPAYRLDGMRRGSDRHGRGSAWYTLIKRDA
jgi:SAM-dependent methyltransferase